MNIYYKKIAPSLLDTKVDKRAECYNWGEDNAFPSLVEGLTSMSVTASSCARKGAKAIYGAGFGKVGDVVVNGDGQTLNNVLRQAAKTLERQRNAFLHVNYNANLNINTLKVIPTTDVRVGKADDLGYSGKYLVYDNWDKSKGVQVKTAAIKSYYKFSLDPDVIESQIRTNAGELNKQDKEAPIEDLITEYPGQILHLKDDDKDIYTLPAIAPVLGDCIQEYNSQEFRRVGADNGFLNAKLLVVPPFKDNTVRRAFLKEVNETRGTENAGGVTVLELTNATDDVTKQLNIQDLTGDFNDKLFEYSDAAAERNIIKACDVPHILVASQDSGLFGNSGALLNEAKVQLWESREEERILIESSLGKIMRHFNGEKRISETLSIINPHAKKEIEEGGVDE